MSCTVTHLHTVRDGRKIRSQMGQSWSLPVDGGSGVGHRTLADCTATQPTVGCNLTGATLSRTRESGWHSRRVLAGPSLRIAAAWGEPFPTNGFIYGWVHCGSQPAEATTGSVPFQLGGAGDGGQADEVLLLRDSAEEESCSRKDGTSRCPVYLQPPSSLFELPHPRPYSSNSPRVPDPLAGGCATT
ncbi:hypothetical protein PR003_g21611 [Phytophthora rubi]|uniref:Uncharacterized protein n=1 Tax=Phytophthora rubi TaxID=129364 RepID=A0A6A3JHD3_9STRA|nr:hypothetical protein PR001_g20368 [Phytophthora rubi]KAE9305003.1 hypothetical protein PR003_g21611 [Phytophthora rubi]